MKPTPLSPPLEVGGSGDDEPIPLNIRKDKAKPKVYVK